MALIFSVPTNDSRKLDQGEPIEIKINGEARQVRKAGTSLTVVDQDGHVKQFRIDEAFPIVGGDDQDQMQFICTEKGQQEVTMFFPADDVFENSSFTEDGYYVSKGKRFKAKILMGKKGEYKSNRSLPEDCEFFLNKTDIPLDAFVGNVVVVDRLDLHQLEDLTFRVTEVGVVEGDCVATLKCTDERVHKPLFILTRYEDGLSEGAKVKLPPSEKQLTNLMQYRYNLSFEPQSRAFVAEGHEVPTDVDVLIFQTKEFEIEGEFSVAYLDDYVVALDRGTDGPQPHAVICGASFVGQGLNVGGRVCLN